MDPRSEENLVGVHPDLVRIMREAAKTAAFVVIHGLRTPEEEAAYLKAGATTTTHSRHFPNKTGCGCAVDVMAMPGGHASWHSTDYIPIAAAVKASAVALDLLVEWGGDWASFKDLGHFQLPWSTYP